MKPVRNISRSFFEVGGCYTLRRDTSIPLRIVSIDKCRGECCDEGLSRNTISGMTTCSRLVLIDEVGVSWCAFEGDFKRISSKYYERRPNNDERRN